ncbi:hypothetical protein ACHAWT_008474 [Skeletonema menzelii]
MTSHSSGGGRGGSMRDFLSKASTSMNDLKIKASNHSSRLSSSFGGRSTTSNMTSSDDALRLPMPEITRPFPVVEQPPRCILSSVSDENIRLTSNKKGLVDVTSNRGDKEQFLLIPAVKNCNEGAAANKKDVYYLKSYKFNRYLTSDSETGEVSTVKISAEINNNVENNGEEVEEEENKKDWVAAAKAKAESALADNTPSKSQLGDAEQWLLMRSPHGGHFLVSIKNELNVAICSHTTNDGEGRRVTNNTVGLLGTNSVEESWDVEFVSGELCFMSSPPSNSSEETSKQIRCDLMGKLSLTTDKRGWEVWRFVEMGGGKVRIVSWMHSQFCISCNHEGKVSTIGIGKAEEGCDEWTVEKAPDGHEGVVIKSVACAKRILCRHDGEGGGLSTMQEFEGDCGLWHLDAAHSQVYTLTSLYHKRSIGPFPYVTDNMKQSDQFVLQMIDDEGSVRLYHKSNGMYLGSNEEGEVEFVTLSDNDDTEQSAELWKMEQSIDGGYTFSSKTHGGLLSLIKDEVNPKLCTVTAMTDDKREVWSINPLLPRAISSGKIKTFAIGTSVAVGTTVAMPFLMAGMLAVVPAEATLAASVMAAGLTGAEAIASVGAIGVTAAIVFREDNDTIGIESEHEENDEGKDYTKRPLCAWRSW